MQQVAQGTALLALIPIWVIGALTHRKTHTLGLREAAAVGLCGALTVPLGAEIASHVGGLPLRVIFAAFLIATVGWGLLRTHRGNQSPTRTAAQQPGVEHPDPGSALVAAHPPGLIPRNPIASGGAIALNTTHG